MKRLLKTLAALRQVNSGAYANALLSRGESLLGSSIPRSSPVALDVILTKACNLRCVFCISYGSLKDQRWMPFDLYERIAAHLFPRAHGVFFCSGGEPFLYPRLREALRLAREHRTLVTVSTNGMLLEPHVADWIVADQSLHELCISFDGGTKATLEKIRRGSHYERILENVRYLSSLKRKRGRHYPNLWIRYVVMRSNIEELPEVFQLCAEYGLERVVVKYLNASDADQYEESLFNHQDLAAFFFQRARTEARRFRIPLELPPLPRGHSKKRRCHYPWWFCQIDTDGSIRFCYQCWRQRVGFFTEDFQSLWRGEHYEQIRRTVNTVTPYYPRCLHCPVRCGYGARSAHDVKLYPDEYLIRGLEHLQVDFHARPEENVRAFREMEVPREISVPHKSD